jgi:hypothetical protein
VRRELVAILVNDLTLVELGRDLRCSCLETAETELCQVWAGELDSRSSVRWQRLYVLRYGRCILW